VNRIFTAFAEPYRVGDDLLPVGASLGVAVFPADGEDGSALLELADAAMYRTKGQGHCAWAQHGVEDVHVVAR
jgi:GGDEF domain-containing protein